MTLPYRLGLLVLIIATAASSGFFYGRKFEQTAALKGAVTALQARETINDETSKLSPFDLCIAIGRLPNECAIFLPRLDKTTKSQ